MKEFKDYEELIKHLELKGVTIKSKRRTIDLIEKYTYYSIINGYKSVFLDCDGNYIEGTTFDEIYALFEFDKKIKHIFLEYLLEIELLIKSTLFYIVSKNYGIKDYLNISNLNSKADKYIVIQFIKKVEFDINRYSSKNKALDYFSTKYNFIPPYVLIKILTYGSLNRYYLIILM